MIEVIAHALFQNRRGEGAERLAMLDAAVQDVFHLRPPRIGHDASVAQGARSELQPSLKPSYNLAVGDRVAVSRVISSSLNSTIRYPGTAFTRA